MMVKELMSSLVNWLNRELVDTRIKVRGKPPYWSNTGIV